MLKTLRELFCCTSADVVPYTKPPAVNKKSATEAISVSVGKRETRTVSPGSLKIQSLPQSVVIADDEDLIYKNAGFAVRAYLGRD